jgi:hypothetical protein
MDARPAQSQDVAVASVLSQASNKLTNWGKMSGFAQAGCSLVAAATAAAGLDISDSFASAADGISTGRSLMSTTKVFKDLGQIYLIGVNEEERSVGQRALGVARYGSDLVAQTLSIAYLLEEARAIELGEMAATFGQITAITGLINNSAKILLAGLELAEIDRLMQTATPEERKELEFLQQAAMVKLLRALLGLIVAIGSTFLVRYGYKLHPISRASLKFASASLAVFQVYCKTRRKMLSKDR